MKYKLVIFDWDGTLMDSAPKIAASMQQAALAANLPPLSYQQATDIIGLSLVEAGQKLYPGANRQQIDHLAEHYRDQFANHVKTPMPLFEGAMDLLYGLKERGHRLAVATGKSRRGLDRVLEQIEAQHLFCTTRTSTEARSKPAPDMLVQILEELEVHPEEAVMVGDSEYDLAMAKAAGMDRIGVSFGVHHVDRLNSFTPVTLLDSLPELLEWV